MHELFCGHPSGPPQKNPGVLCPGQIHSREKDQMRETIGQWTADNRYQRFLQVEGQGRESADRRPADNVAEADEKYARDDPHRGPLFESGQIRFLGDG